MQWSEIWVNIHTWECDIYRAIQTHIYKENGKVPKIAILYIKFSY